MAKRVHFTDKDIQVFLSDDNWEKVFEKRIQDWKVAKFDNIHTFVQRLFNEVASDNPDNVSFKDLLNKLDKAGYSFSQNEFLPAIMHMGSVNENFAETYIQLFTFLESKGFKTDKAMESQLCQMFEHTFHPKLAEFLESKNIDVSWPNVERLIRGLRMKAASTWMEMGAIFKSPSGKFMLHNEAQSGNKNMDDMLLNSLEESQTQEDVELKFILDYLNKTQLNKEQIKELERTLIPPQFRLQQALIKEHGSFNPLEMFQRGTEKKAKPRDWFNESQLKVIDLVEQKYGLKIVEPENNPGMSEKKKFKK